jgi:AbrB family looped-hinge helix DNA binding protein
METVKIKLGKRGTLVLPAQVRKRFGLDDGAMLNLEMRANEIAISPGYPEPPLWSDEERCYFILINSMTKEEWDRNIPDVLALGIDPTKIDGLDANHRDTLPTDAEWDEKVRQAIARREELSVA